MSDLLKLRAYAQQLRADACTRLQADRQRLWPHVPDHEFEAIERAVGEISIFEARTALTRLEEEMGH